MHNQISSTHQLIRFTHPTKCFSLRHVLIGLLLVVYVQPSQATDNGEMEIKSTLCKKSEPLGMESGEITDKQINASSSYDARSVGPSMARLNKDISGGAWCPSQQLTLGNSGTEFIEVHFNERKVINGVATQGRYGGGLGVEFVEEYYLEYSRDGGLTWAKWKNRKGNHLLKGNQDTFIIKDNWLDLPIVGVNAIRLVPYSQYVRMVCLRFELYGCAYKDLPIRYDAPDGEFGGKYGDLVDDTYDGLRHTNQYLSRGLGQLTDGIVGFDDYKVNSGYEWVGWKATSNNSIEIQFEFESLTNFTSVTLHCHNLFRMNIQYFQQLIAYFGMGSNQWSENSIIKGLDPDEQNDNARDITIDLRNRIGKQVKLVLKFAAKYLLISEVTFETKSISRNYQPSAEDLKLVDNLRINKKSTIQHSKSDSIRNRFAQEKDESMMKKVNNFNSNEFIKKENLELKNKFDKFDTSSMIAHNETITLNAILISSVIFVCFCIFLLVSVIFYRKFNKKNDLLANNILKTTLVQNNNKLELMHKLQNVEFTIGDLNKQSLLNLRQPSSLSSHAGTLHKDNLNLLGNGLNSPVTGSSSLINNSHQNNSSNDSSLVRSESNHEYAVPNLSHYEEINQSNYSGFYNKINEQDYKPPYSQDMNQLKQTKLYTNKLAFLANQNGSLNNLTNSLKRTQQLNTFKNHKLATMKMIKNGFNDLGTQLSVNNIKTHFTARSVKNQMINIKSLLFNDLKLNLIQPNQLKLVHSSIGQSKFGNMSLAKIKLDDSKTSAESNRKQAKQLALIETVDFHDMNYDCSLEYKQQISNWLNLIQQLSNKPFYEDIKYCLSNNFAPLLGIVYSDYSPYNNRIELVMDYSNGSLANFLKQHSPETINTNSLLNLTNQLANAMYFLECNNFPYVTLCCRNLGFNKFTFHLKLIMPEILLNESISQSLSSIKNHYNSIKNKDEKQERNVFNLNQQLRWLAPENLTNGQFDCKADVFSFANTIWELWNFCKLLPYPQLTNEQILELFVQSFADLNFKPKSNSIKSDQFNQLNKSENATENEISIIQLKPDNMDNDIYDLLVDCWKLSAEQRLSFSQCRLFFNNKCNYNSNYDCYRL